MRKKTVETIKIFISEFNKLMDQFKDKTLVELSNKEYLYELLEETEDKDTINKLINLLEIELPKGIDIQFVINTFSTESSDEEILEYLNQFSITQKNVLLKKPIKKK